MCCQFYYITYLFRSNYLRYNTCNSIKHLGFFSLINSHASSWVTLFCFLSCPKILILKHDAIYIIFLLVLQSIFYIFLLFFVINIGRDIQLKKILLESLSVTMI